MVNRRQLSTAAVAAATVGLAACGSSPSPAASGPKTLEVWLMAGSAPPSLVTAWNQEFQQAHPGVTVHVDLQQWTNIVTKVDTSLSTTAPPDVLEMGNTDVAGFAATGGLANLSGVNFQNRGSWLESLKEAGRTTASCTAFRTTPAIASSSTASRCSPRRGSRPRQRPRPN